MTASLNVLHLAPGTHARIEPIDDAWAAVYYLDTRDVPTITELRIIPIPAEGIDALDRQLRDDGAPSSARPNQPLSARALQGGLRPGGAIKRFQDEASTHAPTALAAIGLSLDLLAMEPTRRRAKDDRDVWLATLALLYAYRVERGSKTPTRDLRAWINADTRRDENYSASRVRDLIVEARRRDFLAPLSPGRGRAEGRLTDKARRVLTTGPIVLNPSLAPILYGM